MGVDFGGEQPVQPAVWLSEGLRLLLLLLLLHKSLIKVPSAPMQGHPMFRLRLSDTCGVCRRMRTCSQQIMAL